MVTFACPGRQWLWPVIFLLILPALACAFLDDGDLAGVSEAPLLPAADLPLLPEAPAGSTGTAVTKFETAPCPFQLPANEAVRCGYLHVPENRARPDGPTIRLAVAVIESQGQAARPDPLVYLSGGPGDSALYEVHDWLSSPLRQNRAIILLDQRGTGFSQPGLHCPEMDDMDDPLAGARACRQRLARQGVDLSAYNSAASAADVNDLRHALGYAEWNLLGVSYGSRLALTVMRDYPEGLRAIILDSVYPPVADAYTEQPLHIIRAIDAMLAGCAADRACNNAYPDLAGLFYELLEELNEYPVELEDETLLDGDLLVSQLTEVLYDTGAISLLPYVLSEAYYENYDPLLELLEGGFEEWEEDDTWDQAEDLIESAGAYYSVECYEELPFGDLNQAWALIEGYPAVIGDALFFDLEQLYEMCEIWAVGAAGAVESAAVISDVPTLILVGEYDPVTPPSWGRVAGETLSRHYYFELPRGGHGLTFFDDCMMGLVLAFLDDPLTAPDGSCIAPRPFALP
jgi:pimeloyl-ACP methyl ester carboxylesterase